MFKSKAGTEEVDTAETREEAETLKQEYVMAFNGAGEIWIEEP